MHPASKVPVPRLVTMMEPKVFCRALYPEWLGSSTPARTAQIHAISNIASEKALFVLMRSLPLIFFARTGPYFHRYDAAFRTSYINSMKQGLRCPNCWIIIIAIVPGSIAVETEVIYPVVTTDEQQGEQVEVPLDAVALVETLTTEPQALFTSGFLQTYENPAPVALDTIALTIASPPPSPPPPPPPPTPPPPPVSIVPRPVPSPSPPPPRPPPPVTTPEPSKVASPSPPPPSPPPPPPPTTISLVTMTVGGQATVTGDIMVDGPTITVEVMFSEAITGLDAADLSVTSTDGISAGDNFDIVLVGGASNAPITQAVFEISAAGGNWGFPCGVTSRFLTVSLPAGATEVDGGVQRGSSSKYLIWSPGSPFVDDCSPPPPQSPPPPPAPPCGDSGEGMASPADV